MRLLVATLIASCAALATAGTTSAPLLDVERSDVVSILGETAPTDAPVVPRAALPIDVVVDTTVVGPTTVDAVNG
jgi:hypothetical protein